MRIGIIKQHSIGMVFPWNLNRHSHGGSKKDSQMVFGAKLDYKEFVSTLVSLTQYKYRLWSYDVSHSRLQIQLTSLDDVHVTYLYFITVLYMRLPTAWAGFALRPDSSEKCRNMLMTSNHSTVSGRPFLFSIEESHLTVHIICYDAHISDVLPGTRTISI
jgi:hypothetical protein